VLHVWINVTKSSHDDEVSKAYVLVTGPQFLLFAPTLHSNHNVTSIAVKNSYCAWGEKPRLGFCVIKEISVQSWAKVLPRCFLPLFLNTAWTQKRNSQSSIGASEDVRHDVKHRRIIFKYW